MLGAASISISSLSPLLDLVSSLELRRLQSSSGSEDITMDMTGDVEAWMTVLVESDVRMLELENVGVL